MQIPSSQPPTHSLGQPELGGVVIDVVLDVVVLTVLPPVPPVVLDVVTGALGDELVVSAP